jgi:hypothetical protein
LRERSGAFYGESSILLRIKAGPFALVTEELVGRLDRGPGDAVAPIEPAPKIDELALRRAEGKRRIVGPR